MRVLHVSTARTWRGGETQLLHLVRRAEGEVAVALPPDAELARALLGVPTFAIPFVGRWRGTEALRDAVRAFRPDLVTAQDPHATVHALRLAGPPVVVHRRVDFVPSRWGAARYRRATGVVAVSDAVARVLSRVGITRTRVVHDGVDPEPIDRVVADPDGVRAELGLAPGVPLVVAAGALVDHKGHAVLVDALTRLPGVHAAVLGEGARRGALLRRARAAGVAPRLHLPGHRPDVARWLRSADVVAHPSLEEGLGQVVIEALLAGAAVVASRAGGLAEIGPPRLVAPGDPLELATALRDALADPAPLRRRALDARDELVAKFGVDRMVAETRTAWVALTGTVG